MKENVLIGWFLTANRVYNYEPLTPLRTLRANLYGKYVAIRGTVVRVSNIKPICTKLAFTCNSCGDTQSLHLPDGKFTTPTKVQYVICVFFFSKNTTLTKNNRNLFLIIICSVCSMNAVGDLSLQTEVHPSPSQLTGKL